MKKYIYIALASVALTFTTSCTDGSDSVGVSQIDTSTPLLNDLDVWLRSSFVAPYNIEVLYKWDINDTDIDERNSIRTHKYNPLLVFVNRVYVEV